MRSIGSDVNNLAEMRTMMCRVAINRVSTSRLYRNLVKIINCKNNPKYKPNK